MRLVTSAIFGSCLLGVAFAGGTLRPHLAKPVAADVKPTAGAHEAPALTPQEWSKVADAMRPIRPEQFKVLDNMPDGPQKEKARQLIAEQYRQFNAVGNEKLRNAIKAEAHAQDQLFGAQVRLRNVRRVTRGGRLDEKAMAEARADVQQAVATLFDAQIAEKKVRLERLQSEVDRLQANIDRMEKDKPTVIANWTNRLTGQGGRNTGAGANPPSPPRPSGDSVQNNAERAGKP